MFGQTNGQTNDRYSFVMSSSCSVKERDLKNRFFFTKKVRMDHTLLSILIFVVLPLQLILLSNIASAIKCWNCRSDIDSKCADPFDNSSFPIMDCSQQEELPHLPGVKANSCRKIRQKVNGEWRYIRSCAYLGEAGIQGDQRFCLMRTGTYDIFIEYCTCDYKDGCNSSLPRFRLNFHTLSLLLICCLLFLR